MLGITWFRCRTSFPRGCCPKFPSLVRRKETRRRKMSDVSKTPTLSTLSSSCSALLDASYPFLSECRSLFRIFFAFQNVVRFFRMSFASSEYRSLFQDIVRFSESLPLFQNILRSFRKSFSFSEYRSLFKTSFAFSEYRLLFQYTVRLFSISFVPSTRYDGRRRPSIESLLLARR